MERASAAGDDHQRAPQAPRGHHGGGRDGQGHPAGRKGSFTKVHDRQYSPDAYLPKQEERQTQDCLQTPSERRCNAAEPATHSPQTQYNGPQGPGPERGEGDAASLLQLQQLQRRLRRRRDECTLPTVRGSQVVRVAIYLYLYLSIYLSIHLSIYLSIYLSI